jgi:hypothetical protein
MPARSRLLRAAGRKFGFLLVALIALLASAPLIVDRPAGHIAFALFADAVLVASLHAARPGGGFARQFSALRRLMGLSATSGTWEGEKPYAILPKSPRHPSTVSTL